MSRMRRLTACVLTACLSFSLVSCGSLGKPALEKIEEISGELGIDDPVQEVMQLAEDVLPEELVSGLGLGGKEDDPGEETAGTSSGAEAESAAADAEGAGTEEAEPEAIPVTRVSFRKEVPSFQATPGFVPSVNAYDSGPNLSNVINRDQFGVDYMSSEAKDFLVRNHFFVEHRGANSGNPEFYEILMKAAAED